MHVEVDACLLSKNLKHTAYIISHFKEDSRCACIYLKATNNILTIILSNEVDRAIIKIPCIVHEEGESYVTARKFIGLIQCLNGTIELIQADALLMVKQNKSRFSLPTFKDGVVNISPVKMDILYSLTVDGDKLNDMIAITSPFVDKVAQSVISGINIQAFNNTIEMRSCHNAAMAICRQKCETSNSCALNVTLRADTLQAIGKLFVGETIVIEASDKLIQFVGETRTICTRILYGNFPPIDRLLKASETCDLQIDRSVLEGCLRRVLVMKTPSKKLVLNINGNALNISYDNSLSETFEINKRCDEVQIAVNYEYMLSVLQVLSDRLLSLRIADTNKLMFTNATSIITICCLC